MTTMESVKKLALAYNFDKGSVKDFAKYAGCSESYAHIKIREWNTNYKPRVKVYRAKNKNGQFTFKNKKSSTELYKLVMPDPYKLMCTKI